ncbi:hypothetical protein ECEC1849_3334, partial [Escherichia coli EC1849]
MAVMV